MHYNIGVLMNARIFRLQKKYHIWINTGNKFYALNVFSLVKFIEMEYHFLYNSYSRHWSLASWVYYAHIMGRHTKTT